MEPEYQYLPPGCSVKEPTYISMSEPVYFYDQSPKNIKVRPNSYEYVCVSFNIRFQPLHAPSAVLLMQRKCIMVHDPPIGSIIRMDSSQKIIRNILSDLISPMNAIKSSALLQVPFPLPKSGNSAADGATKQETSKSSSEGSNGPEGKAGEASKQPKESAAPAIDKNSSGATDGDDVVQPLYTYLPPGCSMKEPTYISLSEPHYLPGDAANKNNKSS